MTTAVGREGRVEREKKLDIVTNRFLSLAQKSLDEKKRGRSARRRRFGRSGVSSESGRIKRDSGESEGGQGGGATYERDDLGLGDGGRVLPREVDDDVAALLGGERLDELLPLALDVVAGRRRRRVDLDVGHAVVDAEDDDARRALAERRVGRHALVAYGDSGGHGSCLCVCEGEEWVREWCVPGRKRWRGRCNLEAWRGEKTPVQAPDFDFVCLDFLAGSCSGPKNLEF